MFRQDTRALNGFCSARWVRSLSLPVPYSSTHVGEVFGYGAGIEEYL